MGVRSVEVIFCDNCNEEGDLEGIEDLSAIQGPLERALARELIFEVNLARAKELWCQKCYRRWIKREDRNHGTENSSEAC